MYIPKVSIIMPVYNSEKYLEQCLESVVNQTLNEIEIICVDNGSTDNSSDILRKYALADNRIKLIHEEKNMGTAYVRNMGLSLATGKYMIFLDSDDFFELNMLEEAYNAAEGVKCDVVIFDGWEYNNLSNKDSDPKYILNSKYLPEGKQTFTYKDIPNKIFNFTSSTVWNKLYNSKFVKENELKFVDKYNGEYCIDDAIFVNISLVKAQKIFTLNKKMVHYRVGNIYSQENKTGNAYKQVYSLMLCMREELNKLNLFKSVERSFDNYLLSLCISSLKKITEPLIFEDAYNFLKERIIVEFNLLDKTNDYFYKYYDFIQLKKIIEHNAIEYLLMKVNDIKLNSFTFYPFPFNKINSCNNIILYGAGKVGNSYFNQITCFGEHINLKLWVDKQYATLHGTNIMKISSPNEIKNIDYDTIVIAVIDKLDAEAIKKYLIEELEVPENKIIWDIGE